jgi:hypothetical protein
LALASVHAAAAAAAALTHPPPLVAEAAWLELIGSWADVPRLLNLVSVQTTPF